MESSKKRGNYGEDIACALLESFDFHIIERNYYTKQGEIDIIAQRGNITHFIEVKTTYGEYNPAENFHKTKLKRFLKAVRVYCYKHHISDEIIEIDLALVNVKQRRFSLITHANLYFH
jgi:putative endonuclease